MAGVKESGHQQIGHKSQLYDDLLTVVRISTAKPMSLKQDWRAAKLSAVNWK